MLNYRTTIARDHVRHKHVVKREHARLDSCDLTFHPIAQNRIDGYQTLSDGLLFMLASTCPHAIAVGILTQPRICPSLSASPELDVFPSPRKREQ